MQTKSYAKIVVLSFINNILIIYYLSYLQS